MLDACGGIQLHLNNHIEVEAGDHLEFHGTIAKPRGYWTEGASNEISRAASYGYRWKGKPEKGSIKVSGQNHVFSLFRFTDRLRERFVKKLQHQLGNSTSAELLKALLLGVRPERVAKRTLMDAGMVHIVVISGFHVGFFIALAWWFGVRICVFSGLVRWVEPYQFASLVSLLCGSFYCVLSGMGAASMRALIMALFCLVPRLFKFEVKTLNALMLAGMTMLAFRPLWILDFGFQCSFLISGILVCLPELRFMEYGRIAEKCLSVFLANVMAFVATVPLLLHTFGRINPMSVVANVVVVPLVSIIAMPFGVLGLVLPEDRLSELCLNAAAFSLDTVYTVSDWGSQWLLECSLINAWTAVVMLGCHFVFLMVWKSDQKRLGLQALALWCACLAWSQRSPDVEKGVLSIHFVDVGQGDAAWIRFPNGENWLIDVGGIGFGDTAEDWGIPTNRSLVPLLKRHRVKKIDRVVFSHLHADHMAGVFELHKIMNIESVTYLPPIEGDGTFLGFHTLLNELRDDGVGFVEAASQPFKVGDVELQFYGPLKHQGTFAKEPVFNENDNSLAVKLVYKGRQILFLGDLEQEGEELLLENPLGPMDVVKAGHHGSPTSSTEALVKELSSKHVVFSLGHLNRFRFPDPKVIKRWKNTGAGIWRTDLAGTVKCTISSDGKIEMTPFLKTYRP